jgi:hypothetical protein
MRFRLPVAVRRVVVAMTVLGLVGCADQGVHRLVPFFPGSTTTVKVQKKAPVTGVYRVKYATPDDVEKKGLPRIDETLMYVRKGDRVGFYSTPEGQVVAFAGGEKFPLRDLPETAVFCVWTYRAQPETSDFGRQLSDALRGLGAVALIAGVVALVVWSYQQQLSGHGDPCGCDE